MDLSGDSHPPSASRGEDGADPPELPVACDFASLAVEEAASTVPPSLASSHDDSDGDTDVTGSDGYSSSDSDVGNRSRVISGVQGWKRSTWRTNTRKRADSVRTGTLELPVPRCLSLPGDRKLRKKLRWLLRHGAARLCVPLRSDGFVSLRDLVNSGHLTGLTVTSLAALVRSDSSMELTEIDGHPFARVLRGHTIPGVTPPRLTFSREELPDRLVYVTSTWLVKALLQRGVRRLQDRAVLLFMEVPTMPITSSTVVVFLDVRRMMERGVSLVNVGEGIISCVGDDRGGIPPMCIVLVRKELSRKQLYPKVLKAPLHMVPGGSITFAMRPLGRFDRYLWASFADTRIDVCMRLDQFNQLSVMPPAVLDRFPMGCAPQLQASPVTLVYADGVVRRQLQSCVLTLELGDFTFKETFVVDDKNRYATLGSDFCHRYRISVGASGDPFTIVYSRSSIPAFTLGSARTGIPIRCAEAALLPIHAGAEVLTQAATARRTGRPQLFIPSSEINQGGRLRIPYMLFDSRDRQPRVLVVNETDTTMQLEAGCTLGSLVDADEIRPPTGTYGQRRRGIAVADELFAMGWTDENHRYTPQPFRARLVRSWNGSLHLCLDYRAIDRRMKLVRPKVFPSLAGALLAWRRRRRELTLDREAAQRRDNIIDLSAVEWLHGTL